MLCVYIIKVSLSAAGNFPDDSVVVRCSVDVCVCCGGRGIPIPGSFFFFNP